MRAFDDDEDYEGENEVVKPDLYITFDCDDETVLVEDGNPTHYEQRDFEVVLDAEKADLARRKVDTNIVYVYKLHAIIKPRKIVIEADVEIIDHSKPKEKKPKEKVIPMDIEV